MNALEIRAVEIFVAVAAEPGRPPAAGSTPVLRCAGPRRGDEQLVKTS
jgi:hypothetical protein